MKLKSFFVSLVALGFLASCAHLDPHPMDMSKAIRTAETKADHIALAKHYEKTAQRMQAKADIQKKKLQEYEVHGYYYGRVTEDLQEHTAALIRLYEEAAEANMKMANGQRQLAEQAPR
ncbi:hypothetical protein SAMN05216420_102281 [Nitrosospira sp. Nl5]|uniref:hypothetical protein n=1 Tax=Nitrosospira sp. Nl5 TaxID=200120 RepID=UPI00087E0F13|nr:hypothetical protein [Nitrosospira sp. Nl5]SCY09596.1 hypothetical protein SAMN05216420_102281 [Nitrosospira sp. Nl5]